MSEYLSKKAVLEWLESEMSINKGHPDDIDIHWTLNRVSKKIQSGAFDAPDGEVQRLRAALEDIRYQIQQSDHPAGLGILATINQALSTTEPTSAERVREIDELMAIHKEKISYHRQNGNLTQEYFYRGYNAALHRERNRLVGVGINAPEGDGNDA
jgi:hypothetical protein